MTTIVTGKNMVVGSSLTQHIENTMDAMLQKYFSGRGETKVVLSKESSSFECDIKIHLASGALMNAHTRGHGEAQSVFSQAEEKIAKQLRRYKRRLNDYEHNNNPSSLMTEYVVQNTEEDEVDNTEESHLIIAEEAQSLEILTVSDAVMRMDLGNLNQIIFKNITNNHLNILYRRADGHYGWLNPSE